MCVSGPRMFHTQFLRHRRRYGSSCSAANDSPHPGPVVVCVCGSLRNRKQLSAFYVYKKKLLRKLTLRIELQRGRKPGCAIERRHIRRVRFVRFAGHRIVHGRIVIGRVAITNAMRQQSTSQLTERRIMLGDLLACIRRRLLRKTGTDNDQNDGHNGAQHETETSVCHDSQWMGGWVIVVGVVL